MQRYMSLRNLILCLFVTICFWAEGCVYVRHTYNNKRYVTNLLSLKIILHEGDRDNLPEGEDVIQRQWISQSKWYPNPSSDYINISFTENDIDNNIKSENIQVSEYGFNASLPESYRPGEPVNMSVSSELGELSFEGQLGSGGYGHDVSAFGTAIIELNRRQIDKIEEAFGQAPSLDVLIPLIIKNISSGQLAKYADCGIKLSIDNAGELAANDFKAEAVDRLIDAGYKFNGEDFVSLARHHVSGDYAIGWKKAGYDLSANQLVYAEQRNLDFNTALEWQKAGRELSLEQLHWVKQRNIHPQEAMKWKEAGRELSLEQLQWVKQRNIHPQDLVAWEEAGQELSLEKLHWVKQRNIHPREFVSWKEAGRELSLDQLFWVKQRNIHPQDAVKWKEVGRELSLEQLQWVKQRNIHPEDFVGWENAGYELSLEQLYWVEQRNLSPQEAAQWKTLGYDLSIEDLYRLKQNNIPSSYGEAFVDPEYEQVSIEQLIEFKRSNISPETVKKLRKRKEN